MERYSGLERMKNCSCIGLCSETRNFINNVIETKGLLNVQNKFGLLGG